MQKHILSKSTFLRGIQCRKSLYLYKYFYNQKDKITPQLEAIFKQGSNVGVLAQGLFPGGTDASPESYFNFRQSVLDTILYIDEGETIVYEAAFQFNGVLAALDILVKEKDGWKAYEVKSSTEVKDTYINDAALQYYVISNSDLKIDLKDISIVYINNEYVKNGEIDVHQLFTIESVLDRVKEVLPKIPNQIADFKKLLEQDSVPDIDIGMHCFDPYDCDFMGTCWKHIPEYSVFNISNLYNTKKFELYKNGIVTFDQIDLENNNLNSNQLLQVSSELNGETYVDKDNINEFLKGLTYPLYYLDFETINPAIPIYDNSRPYQQLVFQYSLHVQEKPGGELTHFEYLAETDPEIDPRIGFVKQLIAECGTNGNVIVYNISFERGKLQDAIIQFPEYTNELTNIINRLKDLMIPFQQKWYYTPEMKGSYSIKYVLPALVPELSYDNLPIKEGGMASNTFYQMVIGVFDGYIPKTRKDLLEYCELDTYAMVKILQKLYNI